MKNITMLKIMGLFDNDLVLHIMNYVDDYINQKFNVEIVPEDGVSFFKVTVEGSSKYRDVREVLNLTNNIIGNSSYDYVSVVITDNENDIKFDIDGHHDINF